MSARLQQQDWNAQNTRSGRRHTARKLYDVLPQNRLVPRGASVAVSRQIRTRASRPAASRRLLAAPADDCCCPRSVAFCSYGLRLRRLLPSLPSISGRDGRLAAAAGAGRPRRWRRPLSDRCAAPRVTSRAYVLAARYSRSEPLTASSKISIGGLCTQAYTATQLRCRSCFKMDSSLARDSMQDMELTETGASM